MITSLVDERLGVPSSSSADRDFRCGAAMMYITENEIPNPPTEASIRGDRIHAALHSSSLDGLEPDDIVTTKMIMDQEAGLFDEYDLAPADVIRETRFWLKDENGNELFTSKPDVAYLKKGMFVTANYKTGFAYVTPIEINYQIRTECAVLYHHYGEQYGIEVGEAFLLHPHAPNGPMQRFTFTREQMEADLDLIRAKSPRIQSGREDFHAGLIQCQYCPARGGCPAADIVTREVVAKPIIRGDMAPSDLRQEMDWALLASKVIEKREEDLRNLIRAGKVEGYALKAYEQRTISRKASLEDLVQACDGVINRAELLAMSRLTMTDMVAILCSKYGTTEPKAKEMLAQMLDDRGLLQVDARERLKKS